jgi:hypothetical protein
MNITDFSSVLIYQITMDDGIEYQRSANSNNWMRLYGMSWECCSTDEEDKLEAAFQRYVDDI